MDDDYNLFLKFQRSLVNVLDTPVIFVKERIVKPNQQYYPWYHKKYRRVPNIDECDVDDIICYHEANMQFQRDKMVDDQILAILRKRFEECAIENTQNKSLCAGIKDDFDKATIAWTTKYGDLGIDVSVRRAYMKQKHRMVWERRHGPIGTGMKEGAYIP